SKLVKEDSWIESIKFENIMGDKKKKDGTYIKFIGKVFKDDKIKDMLMVNSIKTEINNDPILMENFKYCFIEEMKTVNIDNYNMTNFDITLRQKPKETRGR
ncbi:hypothetical protein KKC59_04680, partial [bacterium]|nr:hypothetical protein [bacterium]